MAESTVSFLVEKLSNLLTEEANLLGNVRQEVAQLKNDMDAMRAFFREADAIADGSTEVEEWVGRVREVAYDIEDILDEFMVRLGRRNGPGFITTLRRGIRFIEHVKARHQIATQIKEIRGQISDLAEEGRAFGFTASEQKWHDPRVASLFLEEDEVVGIEGPRDELIKRLVKGEPQLTVISVLGEGGVGKTTLVKQIYGKPEVQRCFECYAWIDLSCYDVGHPNVEDLLRSMMKQFFDARKDPTPEGINSMKYVQLTKIIKDYLQEKRYVVVLDDVLTIQSWEHISKYVFPDCKNGSRIMVTTGTVEVASSCVGPDGHVHRFQPLNEEKAWTLFCKKAFGLKHMGFCPPELKVVSRQILKLCDGLPLRIVIIGGHLSKKETEPLEWQKVHDNLSFKMENHRRSGLPNILELIYEDLPYHLKSCLLYLSLFPRGYSIECKRLIRLWIAEGFINLTDGRTIEEVATSYLIELMDRSLIQSAAHIRRWQTLTDPLPRRISVHDMTHSFIFSKSNDENLE